MADVDRSGPQVTPTADDENTSILSLRGLRPDNPLGFLAGLGTLRTLSDLDPNARWELRWVPECAVIRRNDGQVTTENGVANAIANALGRTDPLLKQQYPMKGDKDHVDVYKKFQEFFENIDGATHDGGYAHVRRLLDFGASIACLNTHTRKNKSAVVETKFRLVSGNATLFSTVDHLTKVVRNNPDTIRMSLFEPWTYTDDGYSLNWDPTLTQRSHAKSPSPPATAFNPSVYGANRIAFEALSLYPVIDDGWSIQTVGWNKNVFTWPVWDGFAGLDEVRGILATSYDHLDEDARAQIGLTLYSSNRINIDSKGRQKRLTTAYRR